ncbi:MAG: alpha/beta hydrolase-fold protein [Ferruginibacter sp.]
MKKFLIASFLFSITAFTYAQKATTRPFVLGLIDEIKSAELSEARILNIYLPEGYSPDSAATYPVIYLLDGSADEDFIHVAGLAQFLSFSWINVLPKSIIVGIANVDRRRDFTFPTRNKADLKQSPTSGSSAKFIRFLKNDLEPYIQKNYKANQHKTIIGESLGGLLATEILLKEPALFNDYIIISPSLWWDDESLLADAKKTLEKHTDKNIQVYISVGNEGKQMQDDVDDLVKTLKPQYKVFYYPFPEENHATIMHRSLYKAFELLNKKE